MVDILRDIGFAAHDEATSAEPDVLDEDHVAGQMVLGRGRQLDTPEPDGLGLVELEHDAVADAAGLPLPDEAAFAAPGQVFVPFHWANANANQATQSSFDPISREPNYKQSAVRAARPER